MEILIFRGGFFGLGSGMPGSSRRNALHGASGLSDCTALFVNRLRQSACGRSELRIQVPADLDVKPLAFQLEIRQPIVGDQSDQLAQLLHIDRGFLMSWLLLAMPTPVAVTMAAIE